MRVKRIIFVLIPIALIAALVSTASADDGEMFRRNISKTPDAETEKAAIYMMDFYVPAQSSAGVVGPVENYTLVDGTESDDYGTRDYAKPLVSAWIDDLGGAEVPPDDEEVSIMGGMSFGEFDAFAGVSLDDGTSWKRTNLSRSADLSSFTLANGHAYPGDVHNVVHQVAGDQIFVAWVSKYCDGGTPLYTLDLDDNADYFADLEETYGKDAIYLYDLFGVKGTQGSVNYTEQGFPEVGEIPYSCVWTARGKLVAGNDPTTTDATEASHVIWTKPERLTSGARDANLPAVDCAMGAGCILTWQEDPEGLRPGQGLGPGEGWSGAIANSKTDIWYSYISYEDFDDVLLADETVADIAADVEFADEGMPKPYVPMAMPVRLTDNNMCKVTKSDPYCYIDFDDLEAIDPTDLPDEYEENSGADFCAAPYNWTTPDGTTTVTVCVTEDNRMLNGRVASTRVRLNLKPYDADGDGVNDSAWVVMAAEETKALGDVLVDPGEDEDPYPIDIGKDVWYYSFDMFDHIFVDQGGMLNQPAQCKYDYETDPLCSGLTEGDFYPIQVDEREYEYYLSEIARRFALTTNSVQAAVDSESGLSAMLIYKQGIINQGGPADIFLRRVLIDDTDFDPTVDNPYAYENMECEEWVYTDGLNPNYVKGLCLSPAINISGSTIVDCGDAGTDNDTCAAAFPMADDGSNTDPGSTGDFPKMYEWRQLPCDGTLEIEGGDTFTGDPNDDTDLDDQVWENPYDVAKGHRGFLDGDFVMMMYAWSPNWNSNAVGNDHYNLYVRRSFDGGVTWTTTPNTWCEPTESGACGAGLDALEFYYSETIGEFTPALWSYEAGANEQARNVSLLTGNKITILDPRYTPSGGLKLYPTIRTDWLDDAINAGLLSFSSDDALPYDDDLDRDRSKYFMIYETGDNTTVAEGEAVPLDLYYSRATVYGDAYEWYDYENDDNDGSFDEEGNLIIDADVQPRWPWVENQSDILSGEASMLANPGGTFMYTVWNQWQEEILPDGHELIFDSDIWFRRMLYMPDDSTQPLDPTAEIVYASTDRVELSTWPEDQDVILIGTGRDLDRVGNLDAFDDGIRSANWRCDSLGVNFNERTFMSPPTGWKPGMHEFSFQVQDNEGNWSQPKTMSIWVAEKFYDVYMPMSIRS